VNTETSRAKATLRKMIYVLSDHPVNEKMHRWLRIIALKLQRLVTWSLATLDGRLRTAKVQWATSNPAAARFDSKAWFQFKLWHLLALMGVVSVLEPLAALPRSPIFLGAVCAFNAVISTMLVVKARRL
jgi:hypothetical protein